MDIFHIFQPVWTLSRMLGLTIYQGQKKTRFSRFYGIAIFVCLLIIYGYDAKKSIMKPFYGILRSLVARFLILVFMSNCICSSFFVLWNEDALMSKLLKINRFQKKYFFIKQSRLQLLRNVNISFVMIIIPYTLTFGASELWKHLSLSHEFLFYALVRGISVTLRLNVLLTISAQFIMYLLFIKIWYLTLSGNLKSNISFDNGGVIKIRTLAFADLLVKDLVEKLTPSYSLNNMLLAVNAVTEIVYSCVFFFMESATLYDFTVSFVWISFHAVQLLGQVVGCVIASNQVSALGDRASNSMKTNFSQV